MKSLRFLLVAAIPFIAAVPIGWHAIDFYNANIVREKEVVAAWKESQLEYDNLWKSVAETAHVTGTHRDAFEDVFMAGMRVRYDRDAVVTWLRESNPTLPTALYGQVLTLVDQGRDKVTASQARVNHLQKDYDIALSVFPDSLFAAALGLPRAVQGEYAPSGDHDGDGKITVLDYRIVSSERSAEVFDAAEENAAMTPFQ